MDKPTQLATISFSQKLNLMRSQWYCENCQQKLTSKAIRQSFNEIGFFVCPHCQHSIKKELLSSFWRYGFNLENVMAEDAVGVKRQDGLSIIELKWHWKSGIRWLAICSMAFLCLSSILATAGFRFTMMSRDQYIGSALLLIVIFLSGLRSLQFILNRSRIVMKKDRMVVVTEPLSMTNLQVVLFSDIQCFDYWKYLTEKSPLSFSFRFYVNKKDGSRVLLTPVTQISEALYLEKTLLELIQVEKTSLPPVSEEDVVPEGN